MKLFEIDQKIAEAMDAIDWETGEILNEDLYDKLGGLEKDREKKIQNIALYIVELIEFREAIVAQIRKLQAKLKTVDNKIKGFKNFLSHAVNGKKYDFPNVKVSFRKSSSLQFDENFDEEKFVKKFNAWDFVKTETVHSIDKKMARTYFEEEAECYGKPVNYHGINKIEKQNIQIK